MPATPTAKLRSFVLGLALGSLAKLAKGRAAGETEDRARRASARIPLVLDLDVQAKPLWSAGSESRGPGMVPQEGGRPSAVGRTVDSGGTAEAVDRDLGANRLATDTQASEAAFPDQEGFLEHLRYGSSLHGCLHRSDGQLSGLVGLGGAGSSSPTCDSLQRNRASEGFRGDIAEG